jgi:hypothetical protein
MEISIKLSTGKNIGLTLEELQELKKLCEVVIDPNIYPIYPSYPSYPVYPTYPWITYKATSNFDNKGNR